MAVRFRVGADGVGAGAPAAVGIWMLLLVIGASPISASPISASPINASPVNASAAGMAAGGPSPAAIPVSVEAPPDGTSPGTSPGTSSGTSGNEATPLAPQRPATSQGPAHRNDILRRLQREPLTLFDWGLANLERDLHRASQQLGQEDFANVPPRSSATYRWRDGRIRLSASFFVPAAARTTQGCVVQFRRLVDALVAEAPQGPDAASWYLGSAFQPSGHFWTSRFEDTGAKLLQVVDLRVSLRAPSYDKLAGDTRRIDCSGPLNAAEEALRFEAIS
ncbi:hypothetical protein [Pelagibius sp.]|uniref:hypothetical protein n=1 Tax=Pelagibius sp. TaxID=1931238 RepID=UPI002625FD63|nr:hypothetical protein [Pelagibius sp.]